MTLEDLFKKLSYGELSNLAVALDANGGIKKERQNQIVHFANEGLRQLCLRYPIREQTITVALPTGEDFELELADALTITAVITPYGESLSFQTQPIPGTIHFTQKTLHVPANITERVSALQIVYRERHPELTPIRAPEHLNQEIHLAPELEEALTAYIAWKMYAGMNSQDTLAIGAMHQTRYMQILSDLEHLGYFAGNLMPAHKLEARGFV